MTCGSGTGQGDTCADNKEVLMRKLVSFLGILLVLAGVMYLLSGPISRTLSRCGRKNSPRLTNYIMNRLPLEDPAGGGFC